MSLKTWKKKYYPIFLDTKKSLDRDAKKIFNKCVENEIETTKFLNCCQRVKCIHVNEQGVCCANDHDECPYKKGRR
jgi:hypothetical protein